MSAKRVPFNHAASHGSGGADRVPGLFLGAWSGATAYKVGDVVSKAGVIYRCILAHTNQAPPNGTYWTAETTGGSYTDEQAQDAVGSILTDSATIDFTYDDVTPQVTASVKDGSIDGAKLADLATDKVLGRVTAGTGDVEAVDFKDDVQAIAALLSLSTLHRLRAPILDHTGTWAWGSPFPAPWSRWSAQTVLTGTSAADHGEGNVTTSGTPDADDDDTYGPGKRWKTAASAGAAGGFRAPSMSMMRGKWNPSWTYRFKLGTSTNQRFYAGLASATFTDSDTPTNGHWIALRHSTVAGDATFKVLSRDGTTISSPTDTTITPVAGHEYALMVWSPDAGASWKVRLRDITAAAEAEVTHSSNLPDPSTGMGYHCIIWAQEAVLKSHTQRAVFTRLKEFV